MEKKKTDLKRKKSAKGAEENVSCNDVKCPIHGNLSVRGKVFQGTVIRKFPKRITIEFERTAYVRKYERYAKFKTKVHARLPDCEADKVQIGDYVRIKECRPLSKIIHFVFTEKVRDASEHSGAKKK